MRYKCPGIKSKGLEEALGRWGQVDHTLRKIREQKKLLKREGTEKLITIKALIQTIGDLGSTSCHCSHGAHLSGEVLPCFTITHKSTVQCL